MKHPVLPTDELRPLPFYRRWKNGLLGIYLPTTTSLYGE